MKARSPKQIAMGVGLVTCEGKILVHMRQEKLLGGLWVFVLHEGADSPRAMEKHLKTLGLKAVPQKELGNAKHIFTHRIWLMRLMHFVASEATPVKDHSWVDLQELEALPFPTAMKAARREAEKLLGGVK
jgi:A/G-specific adenine glycosylase